MSAAIRPAVKKVATSLDENQNGIRKQRRSSPDYKLTDRTSTASLKSSSVGKNKPKPPEAENKTGLSAALGYISSPVRYLTSVFTQPISDSQKSPPKSGKSRKMATILENTPKEVVQMPESESEPVANDDNPPEGLDTMNMELYEPVIEKKVDLVPNVSGRDKKHMHIISDNKKGSDPKRSNSQLMKYPSKTRVNFSTRNFKESKRQSPSPSPRIQPTMSPRILSASSIKFASNNNRSYRVTSTEKDESLLKKKAAKKVFKIDRDKSPASSTKNQSYPTTAEKRDEATYNYVPLNAIEISRL